MQLAPFEEIIKIQNKGVLTIPKKLRVGSFEDNSLVRIKKEKGRLIIEQVRTLPYPTRSYTDEEVESFLVLDKVDTKELKKKGLI